jgi:methylmalonyl-CoA mutase cobalamin-binding domain/chain
MLESVIKAYNEAIFDTDRDRALKVIYDAIDKGISPEDIVFKVIIRSIELMIPSIVGGNTNLAQHYLTAQISAQIVEEMIPKFKQAKEIVGKVVIGNSLGDFHGLGKRIVIGCLKAHMVDVFDLGLNVQPERFVEEAIAKNAQVIGISSMMVHTAKGENGCLKVRQILRERGLENKIKIIVGGAPYRYDHNLYKVVQADTWAENGVVASRVIIDLIKEVQK